MRITIKQIEYVVEVAKHGSIATACKQLLISQSSVLAAIEAAEEAAGVRVFDRRKGHGVAITPAGQKFLVAARRFLSAGTDFYGSLDEINSAGKHTIRIGCFSPLGALIIPPVIKRMTAEFGEVEFILYEGDQVELRNWLASGMLDVVVTYDIGEEYGSGITKICKVPTHALVRRDDILAQKGMVTIEELSQRPLVLLDLPETRTYLMAVFDLASRRPKLGLRTRSYETIRSAVTNGLGISILNIRPNSESSPDGAELCRIPIADKLRPPTLIVVDPYGENKPAYIKTLIRILHHYILDLGPEKFAVVPPDNSEELIFPAPKF
ncbi:LysR substrate-binding domain-containing protein [Rhizobium sp. NPDC090275]|uniref:LysR substrate-binding domain-containing protein n=1 Tax=Rhizobium sp. NPDC090275 TaxID=3364498 RepID=UPI00383AB33C